MSGENSESTILRASEVALSPALLGMSIDDREAVLGFRMEVARTGVHKVVSLVEISGVSEAEMPMALQRIANFEGAF